LSGTGSRPDLDFTPVSVMVRLGRARTYLDAELSAVFARFGLTAADLDSCNYGEPPTLV